jgi:hypothetical protein
MQQSMESRDAMLQSYRQSRGSPSGEEMHFPRIPPTVQRLVGWLNDCPLTIIQDEMVPLGCISDASSDDEHSQATTHVSPSDNESDEDEIEKWFKPIPLPPDFEGQM